MKINVSKSLARQAEEKARVKPLPTVRVRKSKVHRPPPTIEPIPVDSGQLTVDRTVKDALLNDIRAQIAQMKRDRGKLSTQTAWLVIEIEQKLRKESPATAREFLAGNLTMPELVDHYNKIEALTDKGARLHEQLDHVERYGVMPEEADRKVELHIESDEDVNGLKHHIRRLDDLIHKTSKKIEGTNHGIKTPKNTGRPAQWREKISLAIAERDSLKQKLKRIQHDKREQRLNGE